MAPVYTAVTLKISRDDALDKVNVVLSKLKTDDYYAYEQGEAWYLGIGSYSSLFVDPKGETATISIGEKQEVRPVTGPIADVARKFVSDYAGSCHRHHMFGYVGFNYAAHTRGISYTAGQWPLFSLMVPRTEITIRRDEITVMGSDGEEVTNLCVLIDRAASLHTSSAQTVDTAVNGAEYTSWVREALSEIAQGQYTKVILSRAVNLEQRVDMPATLLCGRRNNNPARSFCLSHSGFQATGFSPELVMSVRNGKVTTEPLAGTRSREGTDTEVEALRQDLLSDPKEIVEHIISVKEAVEELNRLCSPDTVVVDDLMSIRPRGSVQHLGSSVSGILSPEKDAWDALDVLFPSVTASGIPKQPALEAIQRLENRPRELYSGAVLLIEDSKSLEAALVLRTVFQDQHQQWIQAGAGVIIQSRPKRELTETCEKMASVAPYVIADRK